METGTATVAQQRLAKIRARAAVWGPAPRLGPAHLLLWMSCAAAALTINKPESWVAAGVVGLISSVVRAMVTGVMWSGGLVYLWRLCRRAPWPIEPGHWLLIAFGVQRLVTAALTPISKIVVPTTVSATVPGCLLLIPLLNRRYPPVWRAVLGLLLLLYCGPVIKAAGNVLGVWPESIAASDIAWWLILPLAGSLLIAVGVIQDMRTRHRGTPDFGWIHYVGIATWIASLLF